MQFFTIEVKSEVEDVKSIPAWENKHLPGKAAGRHVCIQMLAMSFGHAQGAMWPPLTESLAEVSKMQIIFQYHVIANARLCNNNGRLNQCLQT